MSNSTSPHSIDLIFDPYTHISNLLKRNHVFTIEQLEGLIYNGTFKTLKGIGPKTAPLILKPLEENELYQEIRKQEEERREKRLFDRENNCNDTIIILEESNKKALSSVKRIHEENKDSNKNTTNRTTGVSASSHHNSNNNLVSNKRNRFTSVERHVKQSQKRAKKEQIDDSLSFLFRGSAGTRFVSYCLSKSITNIQDLKPSHLSVLRTDNTFTSTEYNTILQKYFKYYGDKVLWKNIDERYYSEPIGILQLFGVSSKAVQSLYYFYHSSNPNVVQKFVGVTLSELLAVKKIKPDYVLQFIEAEENLLRKPPQEILIKMLLEHWANNALMHDRERSIVMAYHLQELTLDTLSEITELPRSANVNLLNKSYRTMYDGYIFRVLVDKVFRSKIYFTQKDVKELRLSAELEQLFVILLLAGRGIKYLGWCDVFMHSDESRVLEGHLWYYIEHSLSCNPYLTIDKLIEGFKKEAILCDSVLLTKKNVMRFMKNNRFLCYGQKCLMPYASYKSGQLLSANALCIDNYDQNESCYICDIRNTYCPERNNHGIFDYILSRWGKHYKQSLKEGLYPFSSAKPYYQEMPIDILKKFGMSKDYIDYFSIVYKSIKDLRHISGLDLENLFRETLSNRIISIANKLSWDLSKTITELLSADTSTVQLISHIAREFSPEYIYAPYVPRRRKKNYDYNYEAQWEVSKRINIYIQQYGFFFYLLAKQLQADNNGFFGADIESAFRDTVTEAMFIVIIHKWYYYERDDDFFIHKDTKERFSRFFSIELIQNNIQSYLNNRSNIL